MIQYDDVSKYSQSNNPYNLCLEVISKITIFFNLLAYMSVAVDINLTISVKFLDEICLSVCRFFQDQEFFRNKQKDAIYFI